jgi:hypothetical protein
MLEVLCINSINIQKYLGDDIKNQKLKFNKTFYFQYTNFSKLGTNVGPTGLEKILNPGPAPLLVKCFGVSPTLEH